MDLKPQKRIFGKTKIKNKILENLKKEKRRYNYSKRCTGCKKVFTSVNNRMTECRPCRALTVALSRKFQNKKIELSVTRPRQS